MTPARACILTLDCDWAPDFMLDHVREKLAAAGAHATLFVTHPSQALDAWKASPDLELGWHPNFLPGSTQGGDPEAVAAYLESIGVGGAAPSSLKPTGEKVAQIADPQFSPVATPFDSQGNPKNCHYSVWTYGWYCGSFFEALVYHLKNQ